jgi:hypothetical protein
MHGRHPLLYSPSTKPQGTKLSVMAAIFDERLAVRPVFKEDNQMICFKKFG